MSRTGPHQVLGLAPGADRAAIEAAYKRLIKQHHPDKVGGDPEAARSVIHAYRELTRRSVLLPVTVEAPPEAREVRQRHWPALLTIAAGLLLWALPWQSLEWRRSVSPTAVTSPAETQAPEPRVTAAKIGRVMPDSVAVEAGVAEARRLARQSSKHAAGYSRSCAADLERLPGDALLDHCLAFDMAAGAGDRQWGTDGMRTRHVAAAEKVLGDEVLAAARVRAVRLQVERALVEAR